MPPTAPHVAACGMGRDPGAMDQEHNWQERDCRSTDLTRCGGYRSNSHRLKPSHPNPREGVGECGTQARKPKCNRTSKTEQGVWANDDHRATKADQHAEALPQIELLVVCQDVRDQHSENRRGGVQNGGETTGDAVLTPDNEHKRQDIVEDAHAEEG